MYICVYIYILSRMKTGPLCPPTTNRRRTKTGALCTPTYDMTQTGMPIYNQQRRSFHVALCILWSSRYSTSK